MFYSMLFYMINLLWNIHPIRLYIYKPTNIKTYILVYWLYIHNLSISCKTMISSWSISVHTQWLKRLWPVIRPSIVKPK